jgi:Tfp pilus assembly protein PilO
MALLPQDPKDQRFMLAGIVPLALLFAYHQYVGKPRATEVESLTTHVQALETQNATARAIEAQQGGPHLQQRVAQLEEHVEFLEGLVPRKEDVPVLLRDISLRARDTRLQLTRLKPETEEAGDHYVKRTYEINVQGAYHSIGMFLSDVGSLSRIMTPIDLKLITNTGKVTNTGSPILNANFRLLTYIVPPAGESPEDHLSPNIVAHLSPDPGAAAPPTVDPGAASLDTIAPAALDSIARAARDSASARATAVDSAEAQLQRSAAGDTIPHL